MNVQQDMALFSAVGRDDKGAFDRIFYKYYPVMCVYARGFVPEDQAEEIVQGIMVSLWERRRSIRLETALHSYLFTSVRNKCLSASTSARRRERLRAAVFERMRSEVETPDYYDMDLLTLRIEQAMDRLPEPYRLVFRMNRYEDKTYRQIADELDISPKTVDYRICQSLKILRRELKDFLPMLLPGIF